MAAPWDSIKILADPTRLRILRLLSQENLSVGELQEILEMGQSRISSHLALLRQGGLAAVKRDGKKTIYSAAPELPHGTRRLLDAAFDAIAGEPETKTDERNLARVVEKRRRSVEQYFNTLAGRLGKNYCPGRSWEAVARLLFKLVPRLRVADLGAGEGMLSQLLARRAEFVWCVDNSPRMVAFGSESAKKHGVANLEYRLGDIEAVPLDAGSVDFALFSQALHHAQHPDAALREAWRILRPGGSVLILDLLQHDFEKARELYADQWLGFSENTLFGWLVEAGFTGIDIEIVAREPAPPHFETLLASATKPA
ncbi:MAG: metalloregulator ArsR/SmtB family transcription factor [Puniceicoccales bacterium]|jgi:ArsR family transcriptional regulator|nr:metalloregulator ArsR/SmtB family transcription factor [Puniceicoccales bacterium]